MNELILYTKKQNFGRCSKCGSTQVCPDKAIYVTAPRFGRDKYVIVQTTICVACTHKFTAKTGMVLDRVINGNIIKKDMGI